MYFPLKIYKNYDLGLEMEHFIVASHFYAKILDATLPVSSKGNKNVSFRITLESLSFIHASSGI